MGEVNTPYQYTGQKWEENDALEVYYYQARWYDPALRRFLQPDTIVPEPGNPQTLNRYAYVLNKPMTFSDPTGYEHEEGPGRVADVTYWYNLEYWAVRQFNANAQLPEFRKIRYLHTDPTISKPASLLVAWYMFIQLVWDGAPTDYKDKMKEAFGTNIRLGDEWFEYSFLGNTAFGWNSACAGMTRAEAHLGAGVAQLLDHYGNREGDLGPWYMAFDTSDDYYAIELGFDMYEIGYLPDKDLTVAEFHSLTVGFARRDQFDFGTGPERDRDVNTDWPYWPGYFDGKEHRPSPAYLFPSFP